MPAAVLRAKVSELSFAESYARDDVLILHNEFFEG